MKKEISDDYIEKIIIDIKNEEKLKKFYNDG